MRRRFAVAVFGLYLIMSAYPVLADELGDCRSGCETDDSDCQRRASEMPNELDMRESLDLCEPAMNTCYQRCEQEKVEREQREKEEQEKKQEERSSSPFVAPQEM